MRKLLALGMLLTAILSPTAAEELSAFFDCKEFYQQGKFTGLAKGGGAGWFFASGFSLTFLAVSVGTNAFDMWEDDTFHRFGALSLASVGVPLLLPAIVPARPPSTSPYEDAEAQKCYAKGYAAGVRLRNIGFTVFGSAVGWLAGTYAGLFWALANARSARAASACPSASFRARRSRRPGECGCRSFPPGQPVPACSRCA
jgi:hypothetical protein